MNIFEQLLKENGYEGFINKMINAGVDELRMHRFMDIMFDANGPTVYNTWLTENTKEISIKLGDQEDNVTLALIMINEFMIWFDGITGIISRG